INHHFVAGTKDVVRANRNAQRGFVLIERSSAIAEECGAKPLQLGFVGQRLGIKIAQSRKVAQGILLLRRPWGLRPVRNLRLPRVGARACRSTSVSSLRATRWRLAEDLPLRSRRWKRLAWRLPLCLPLVLAFLALKLALILILSLLV